MLLEVLCPDHGVQTELVRRRPSWLKCPICGARCKPVYSTFGIAVGFRPGWQPAFGRSFDTQRELNNAVAEAGYIRDK